MNLFLFTALALSSPPVESAQSLGTCTLSGTLTAVSPSKLPFEPEYAEVYVDTRLPVPARNQEHLMRQLDKAFIPRILVVEQEDTVLFKNEDKQPHEIHADKDKNTFVSGENLKPETFRRSFQDVGETLLGCRIHSEMSGVILTVPNSFHARVAKGKWSISGLPRKQVKLVFWLRSGSATRTEIREVTPCDTESVNVTIENAPQNQQKPYGGQTRTD
ncbi:MAG: hypothetical protein QM817_28480 [Archangium sp.]